jgi:hypothetical protein
VPRPLCIPLALYDLLGCGRSTPLDCSHRDAQATRHCPPLIARENIFMKSKPYSFAYCYAKQVLRRKTSKYAPLLSLVAGLALLGMAFGHSKLELADFVFALLILYSAVHSWLERGKEEAFQEAESIIEELRSAQQPNQPPQVNS